jgi:(p)ppGpp synthase/HD superfamily hydrolase
MNEVILKIAKAFDFAAQKHSAQRRKGEHAEPYINHPAEVARLLAEATGGEDPNLIMAGMLHDTVEDCGVSHADLVREFGSDVAELVREVTDDKSLTKDERKRKQVENAPHKSRRAQMVKIADKISNLRAILESPPSDWALTRKQEYFDWAASVVAGCRGSNASLEAQFDALLARKGNLG